MTKVDIKRLDSITKNDTTATEQINDNFKALQEAIENTLSRDGTGPNYMDADLDMNSYRIINSSDPVEDNDIVNLKYVEDRIGGAIEASHAAVNAATQAANSAQSALVSSTNAINAVRNAEEQLNNTITYVDEAKQSITDTINEALDDVKQQALDAAQESIDTAAEQATAIVIEHTETVIKPEIQTYVDSSNANATIADNAATVSRTWATGTDEEVQAIEDDEHSSRTYANFAMALANAAEDVPVLESTLLATNVIQGPKGDKGDSWNGGDITNSINVINDSNHPVQITGMAGASATGYQIIDSNGLGESDFEHYATGDRYGTRIANKSTATGKSVNVDLYQTTAGKSVLDLSKPDTILAPQLLNVIYPVGSIYITTNATCPIADLGVGTWELVAEDRVLQGAGTRGAVGTELAESLPNLKSNSNDIMVTNTATGLTQYNGNWSGTNGTTYPFYIGDFDASRSSPTYQDNAPVQPDAYLVNIFRRTM